MSETVPKTAMGETAKRFMINLKDSGDMQFLKGGLPSLINVNMVASTVIIGLVVASAAMIIGTELLARHDPAQ